MDSNEALEYLKKMHEQEASQTPETAPTEGPADTAVQTEENPEKQEQAAEPETEAKADREPDKAKAPETAAEKQQKKPSKQDKINHAFQREKQRHRQELDEKNKRIAELEEKVKKYSVLEQGDFDPNDVKSYIDHKLALNAEKGELDSLKKERDRMVAEDQVKEANERHRQQVDECFTDDAAKEHYWNLLRNGGDKFRQFLNDYDPDGTIDSFVGDSKIAPLVISTLMRNTDVLKNIVEMRNPMRKMLALQQLENRLNIGRKVGTSGRSQGATQTKPKAPLPILGSQVQTPGSSAESEKRDWNRYLAEHPRSSGY